MKKLSSILLTLILSMVIGAPLWAAPSTAIVSGTVYGAGGSPSPNTVIVFNTPQQIIGGNLIQTEIISTRTNQNGEISPITLPQAAVTQITVGNGMPVTGIVPLAAETTFEMVLAGSVFSGGAFKIENVNISNQSALNFTEGANISIENPSGSDVEISLTGIVPVSLGGTGLANLTQYGVLIGGGTGPLTVAAPGTSGYCFVANGGAAPPTFQPCPGPPTSGTVVSVGLSLPATFAVTNSPVTTTGTLTATFVAQNPNNILAGPAAAGPSAVPTWRALVAADIPLLSASKINSGTLPIGQGGTGSSSFTATGAVIYLSGGNTLTSTTNSGTAGQCLKSTGVSGAPGFQDCTGVSSVGLSLPTAVFALSGSPVTGAGTLTAVFNNQAARAVFAAPSGGDGVPNFRYLEAIDLPALTSDLIPQLSTSHMPAEGITATCTAFPIIVVNGIITGCN